MVGPTTGSEGAIVMARKSIRGRNWLMIALISICTHYAVSVVIWLSYLVLALYCKLRGDHVIWAEFYAGLVPAALLIAAILCWRVSLRNKGAAKLLLIGIVIASALLFSRDVHSDAYQVRLGTPCGCKHIYFTWWWYWS